MFGIVWTKSFNQILSSREINVRHQLMRRCNKLVRNTFLIKSVIYFGDKLFLIEYLKSNR